jgi:hypothetical protein
MPSASTKLEGSAAGWEESRAHHCASLYSNTPSSVATVPLMVAAVFVVAAGTAFCPPFHWLHLQVPGSGSPRGLAATVFQGRRYWAPCPDGVLSFDFGA